VQGPALGEGSRRADDAAPLPHLVLAAEHYGRIARLLQRSQPVHLEVDVRNRFYDDDLTAFNVIAELKGTDKAAEIVMVGAHFDSWHVGTGATDNGANSAVIMETMRILKTTGLKMRRTVRAALWTGEEQGLLGSRAYVQHHFADRATLTLKPAHDALAAYFNLDNGGGAVRGVYLQGNDMVAPIFLAWMEPFRGMGMTTLARTRRAGGTDHIAFDEVGLPGFQFIQDPLDYDSRTHHTHLDVYERLVPEDLIKNAIILASFVYHAANRPDPLPRKPLPPPGGPVSRAPGTGGAP
jgi:Zn-dependent M28 family amino/carboxypeptidase